MISKDSVLTLHELSIIRYGGSDGIRDEGLLDSAIARPYQTFGGEDLYPSVLDKAAAIAESLIVNHPFTDGNKRTGFLAMLVILNEAGIEISVSNDAIYHFILNISTGELKFKQIVAWLRENTAYPQ
jgi:death on curing protein